MLAQHLQPSNINRYTVVDIVRCMPDVARAVLADDFRKAYQKLDAYLGRWVEQALERMHEEQQALDHWLEEHEKGGGPLSKEEELEYWLRN